MELSQITRRPPRAAERQPRGDFQEHQIVLANHPNKHLRLFKRLFFILSSLGIGLLFYVGLTLKQSVIDPSDFKARTDHLLGTFPLVDGHNDLPFLLRMQLDNKIYDGCLHFREGKHAVLYIVTSRS